jgi:hypothetical protein
MYIFGRFGLINSMRVIVKGRSLNLVVVGIQGTQPDGFKVHAFDRT